MEYRHRTMEYNPKVLEGFPVILLAGPRQVGKTTLLNYLSRSMPEPPQFVTLDDINLRMQANEDPEAFLSAYDGRPLVIDEFQYAPGLLSYIKMRVDRRREEALFERHRPVGTMYYLTGSQVFESMKNVSESLAGRIGLCTMYALSARELDGRRDVVAEGRPFIPDIGRIRERRRSRHLEAPELFERITAGAYPELTVNPALTPDKFYASYVKTYLERDVRALATVKDEVKFLKFLQCLAARTAQEYNATSIAGDVQIDAKTADEWLSVAKNTYLVHLVQPYANNATSKAIKRPKVYFTDTGLASYLAGYSGSTLLQNSAYSGAIFETYVVNEILKAFANSGVDVAGRLYFYRDYSQKEIDLIVREGDRLYPIEIKKTATTPGADAVKNFEVMEKLNPEGRAEVMPGVVLCNVDEITPIAGGNFAVPVEYI